MVKWACWLSPLQLLATFSASHFPVSSSHPYWCDPLPSCSCLLMYLKHPLTWVAYNPTGFSVCCALLIMPIPPTFLDLQLLLSFLFLVLIHPCTWHCLPCLKQTPAFSQCSSLIFLKYHISSVVSSFLGDWFPYCSTCLNPFSSAAFKLLSTSVLLMLPLTSLTSPQQNWILRSSFLHTQKLLFS